MKKILLLAVLLAAVADIPGPIKCFPCSCDQYPVPNCVP